MSSLEKAIDHQHAGDCLETAMWQLERTLHTIQASRVGREHFPNVVKKCDKLAQEIRDELDV